MARRVRIEEDSPGDAEASFADLKGPRRNEEVLIVRAALQRHS